MKIIVKLEHGKDVDWIKTDENGYLLAITSDAFRTACETSFVATYKSAIPNPNIGDGTFEADGYRHQLKLGKRDDWQEYKPEVQKDDSPEDIAEKDTIW